MKYLLILSLLLCSCSHHIPGTITEIMHEHNKTQNMSHVENVRYGYNDVIPTPKGKKVGDTVPVNKPKDEK